MPPYGGGLEITMKKTFIKMLCITLALLIFGALTITANEQLKTISAYLNYAVDIMYNGEAQTMYDANGTQVYPITYNGTTYLPVRAVANLFGIGVDWDAKNNAVLLGEGAPNTNPETTSTYDGYTVTKLPYTANDVTLNSVSISGTKASFNVTNNTEYAIGGNSTVAYTCYNESGDVLKTSTFYLENMNDGESAVVDLVLAKGTAKVLLGDITVHKGTATDTNADTCNVIEVTKLPYEIKELVISSAALDGTKVTISVTNNTGAAIKAISNIAYKCYNANGAVIKSGAVYLAAMNDGESADVSFYIEDGTAKILFGDADIYNQ